MLKGVVGAGVLTMPKAFHNAGYALGIPGTILLGSLCVYGVHTMVCNPSYINKYFFLICFKQYQSREWSNFPSYNLNWHPLLPIGHLKATFCTHETRLSLFSLIIMTPVSLGISQETHSGCGVWFIPDHLSPDSNSCNYLFNFFISCYSIVHSSIVKMSLNNVPVDNAEDPVPATQGALPHPSTLLKDRFPQWTQTLSQTCLACSVCMFFYSLSLIFSYKT